jgi:hypothetical protein
MDRRETIKWMLAAAASVPLLNQRATSADVPAGVAEDAHGYGTDPDLTKNYLPGDLWPLLLTPAQRRTASALCDVIIPQDASSPAASAVGVVDFIAEWVSAPYPIQERDRPLILQGLTWIDTEAGRRFARDFAAASSAQQRSICDDICLEQKAKPVFAEAAKFFARYRDLTAGGFYSTRAGRQDLQYIGNVPLASFDGPPLALLHKLGLTPEPQTAPSAHESP